MKHHWTTLACLLLAVAVILGAFGAHSLKSVLSVEQLASWKTGVLYHFLHSIGILVLGYMYALNPSRMLRISLILHLVGIVFFSGSIYLLTTVGWSWLGPVTPLGGLCFIAGWICAGFGIKQSLDNA